MLSRQNTFGEAHMLYAVLFEDDPARGPEVRRQHMPAHLGFLEANARHIRAAGPLRDSSGEAAGGLWLVEADTLQAVDALVTSWHGQKWVDLPGHVRAVRRDGVLCFEPS